MIRLKTKNSEAGLITDGACLTHFAHQGVDILRPNHPFQKNPLNAACFPCAPYFGRIANGITLDSKSTASAQHWPLLQTNPDIDTPIHGEAWINSWYTQKESSTQIILSQKTLPSVKGRYPFAWHATKTIILGDNNLAVEMVLKNTNHHAAPFGLGLHPFFPRFPDTKLQFDFETLYTPPEFSAIPLEKNAFTKRARLPDFTIDHSFVHWSGSVNITGNHGRDIILTSDAPYLHIYAPQGENFFCLEPITQLPGAYSNPTSLSKLMLMPEENLSIKMVIETK